MLRWQAEASNFENPIDIIVNECFNNIDPNQSGCAYFPYYMCYIKVPFIYYVSTFWSCLDPPTTQSRCDHLHIASAEWLGGWVWSRNWAFFADCQYCIYADLLGGSETIQNYTDVIYGWPLTPLHTPYKPLHNKWMVPKWGKSHFFRCYPFFWRSYGRWEKMHRFWRSLQPLWSKF